MPTHLPWYALPMVAGLLLVATHTYLGLHVVSRNVFFVDLALAQIAALGTSVAVLFGFEMGDSLTYWVSLLFALLGAWFFAIARTQDERVPQEAIIGLAFAVASAGSILLSAENPHGAEHLRDVMSGSILVVSWTDLRNAALLYAAISVAHWAFRRQFLLVSSNPAEAARQGLSVRAWDFFFYLTFALTITISVRIAGVLLVFCLLIAPAVCAAMFTTNLRARLLIGWACGLAAVCGGLVLSAQTDWPPAPSITCVFALLLVGCGVGGHVKHSARPAAAAAHSAEAFVVLGLLGWGLVAFLRSDFAQRFRAPEEQPGTVAAASTGHGEADHAGHSHGGPEHPLGTSLKDLLAGLHDEHDNVRGEAAVALGKLGDASAVEHLTHALADVAEAVREKAAHALGILGRAEAAGALETALAKPDEDEWVRLCVAEALARCGGGKGLTALLGLAADADAKLVRGEALKLAAGFAGRGAPQDADGPGAKALLTELVAWWKGAAARARWDAAAKRFVE
ncbi:MAG: metal ABC transporter permease [Planctomycetes bacterium]|nr:metal ABC transporter permease [Planctomycetota bacterium]